MPSLVSVGKHVTHSSMGQNVFRVEVLGFFAIA